MNVHKKCTETIIPGETILELVTSSNKTERVGRILKRQWKIVLWKNQTLTMKFSLKKFTEGKKIVKERTIMNNYLYASQL